MTRYFQITTQVTPEGKLPLILGERARDVLKQLAGKHIHMVIESPKRYSTSPQRQYYFGVIVTEIQNHFVANGQWIDKDSLHEMMMTEIGELWVEQPNPFSEKITKKRRSYNSLSIEEAEIYHSKCRAWAAQQGIDIQEPHETEEPPHE